MTGRPPPTTFLSGKRQLLRLSFPPHTYLLVYDVSTNGIGYLSWSRSVLGVNKKIFSFTIINCKVVERHPLQEIGDPCPKFGLGRAPFEEPLLSSQARYTCESSA